MTKAQVLKLLHKKINLGSEHVHLFRLVNLAGAGRSTLIIPTLIRSCDTPSVTVAATVFKQ
jgi:hypothetical protein